MNVHEHNSLKKNISGGAGWLVLSAVAVKIIGVVYKIPLTAVLGTVGKSYYSLAYNLFVPVYSVALAGLPVAVSKTVSKYSALKKYGDVNKIFKASLIISVLTGIAGTVFLFAAAKPYVISVNSHNAVYSVFVIAPTVLLCTVMGVYRGYYNGLENTKPSAVSEIAEAVGKLVLGLAAAKLIITYGIKNGVPGNNVFGLFVTADTPESEIKSAIYPFAAAGSLAGVTSGTVFALGYLVIYKYREKKKNPCTDTVGMSVGYHIRELIEVLLPIVAGTLIFNALNIIDSWTVQNRLAYLIENHYSEIESVFYECFKNIPVSDRQSFLYGAYETAVDFKNFIPSLTLVFGIGAIPVLSYGITVNDRDTIKNSVEAVLKMCIMISVPSGIVMGIMSKQILTLMYSSSESIMSALPVTSKIMLYYGLFAFIFSITQPLTLMLQAVGKTKTTVIATSVGALLKVIINYGLMSDAGINISGAVIGSVVCYSVICIIETVSLVKFCKIKISVKSVFIKPFLCSVISGISVFCAYGLINTAMGKDKPATVISICFSAVIYVIFLFLSGTVEKNDVLLLPKGEKINKILEKYGIIG